MGCCNQPPNGGTKQLGTLIKIVAVMFALIFLLALFA